MSLNTNLPQKALVTGGAGFIGSNLVRLLVEHSVSVRALDNLSTGYIKNDNEAITPGRLVGTVINDIGILIVACG